MIEIYLVLLFLSWYILSIGFKQKDFGIVSIDGIFMMILGIFALTTNLDIHYSLRIVFGILNFWMGFYIVTRAAVELTKLDSDNTFNLIKYIKEKYRRKYGNIQKEKRRRIKRN